MQPIAIPSPVPLGERFWSKVDKSAGPEACWVWTAGLDGKGYGSYCIRRGRQASAHRVAWADALGDPGTLFVDHICHNRRCVNLRHLRLATAKQNTENAGRLSSHNTSGYRGVSWSKQKKAWIVRVVHNARVYHGGSHPSREAAHAAAVCLRNALFSHNDADRLVLTD